MRKLLIAVVLTILPFSANSTPAWMGSYHKIGDIYTYDTKDSMSVFLVGSTCQNTKNYYTIRSDHAANARQLIAIVLTAKTAGKNVRFYVDSSLDPTFCYIKGIWVRD